MTGRQNTSDERADLGAVDRVTFHLTMAMRSAVDVHGPRSRPIVTHLEAAMHAHVAEPTKAPLPAPKPSGLSRFQLVRAEELLMTALDSSLSLEDVARASGLSRGHFVRSFKASTGMTPRRWLLARRVELAKRLMHDTRLSLAEVAVASGFADQSHLSRVFKRIAGTSPAAFRNTSSAIQDG